MRIYRASGLGYSLEQMVAPYLGYEPAAPPETLQRAYDEGNRLEPIIINALRDDGWNIYGEQTEVEIEIVPGAVIIQGHIDGYYDGMEGKAVLEIKTMAHASYLDWDKNGWESKSALIEKYKWQQSAYVIATGLPHVMVGWDKSRDRVASVRITLEPFFPVEELAKKVLAAEQYIRDGELPEGCEDYPCPYFYLHADKDKVPVEAADDNLEDLLVDWLDADQKIKKLEKYRKSLRDAIIGDATDSLVAGKIKGACGVTVSTNWVEGKEVSYKTEPHWETRIQGPRKNG